MTKMTNYLLLWVFVLVGAVGGVYAGLNAPVVQAQPGLTTNSIYDAYDFDNQTVGATAVGLTATKVLPTTSGQLPARQATCVVETNSVRIRYDGTNPTASVGLLYTAGTSFAVYGGNNIRRLRAIRVTSDAAIHCQLAR